MRLELGRFLPWRIVQICEGVNWGISRLKPVFEAKAGGLMMCWAFLREVRRDWISAPLLPLKGFTLDTTQRGWNAALQLKVTTAFSPHFTHRCLDRMMQTAKSQKSSLLFSFHHFSNNKFQEPRHNYGLEIRRIPRSYIHQPARPPPRAIA